MEESGKPTERPLGVALIVCEQVITDTRSNNKTLVSTFNSISAREFPCTHHKMAVYVALTNGSGEMKVNLVLKNLSNDKRLLKFGGSVTFDNPNHVLELIFNIRQCVFEEPGLYGFEVYANEEHVFESRFNVVKTESKS